CVPRSPASCPATPATARFRRAGRCCASIASIAGPATPSSAATSMARRAAAPTICPSSPMSRRRSRHLCCCRGRARANATRCSTRCEALRDPPVALRLGGDSELAGELVDERLLIDENLLQRRVDIEIGDAVDLRKALPLAGARRPFRLEVIAAALREIEVGG